MRKIYTVVKGSREVIQLQARRVSDNDPFPLTNVTGVSLRIKNDDETIETVEGQIVDGTVGKMNFILTPEITSDLQAKDAQTVEVVIAYADETLNRVVQFENAICVKEALE